MSKWTDWRVKKKEVSEAAKANAVKSVMDSVDRKIEVAEIKSAMMTALDKVDLLAADRALGKPPRGGRFIAIEYEAASGKRIRVEGRCRDFIVNFDRDFMDVTTMGGIGMQSVPLGTANVIFEARQLDESSLKTTML